MNCQKKDGHYGHGHVIAFTSPTTQINGVRKIAIRTRLSHYCVTKGNNIKVIEGKFFKR